MNPPNNVMGITHLIVLVPLLPALTFAVILSRHVLRFTIDEVLTYRLSIASYILSLLIIISCGIGLHLENTAAQMADLGAWFEIGHERFEILFSVDALGLIYSGFSLLLVAIVAAFSRRYLHREPGFDRFYTLLALFALGLVLTTLAGSLEMLIIGWELVGISSTLLIAFFNHRPKPVRNALRAFVTYRACDIGLLFAILALHRYSGHTDFVLSEVSNWSGVAVHLDQFMVSAVALALIWAAMGKSAQVPLSGWLPRAMEGPTPSSAIFYGALSVHLGPFLLLRAAPLMDQSNIASGVLILIGLLTVLHSRSVGNVQTDIKSKLAYGSISQVGLIFVEIGLGWYQLALIHMIGHALFRSLQILRAPNLLHDRHHLEQMLGHHVSGAEPLGSLNADKQPTYNAYRRALERGGLDALLRDLVIERALEALRRFDAFEQRCAEGLARWAVNRVKGAKGMEEESNAPG